MIFKRNSLLLVGSIVLIGLGLIIMSVFSRFFDHVSQDMDKWESRKELVAGGQIEPLEATVTGKRFEKREYWTGSGSSRKFEIDLDYWVAMEVATVGPMTRGVSKKVYESISEGESFEVYPVDGVYVIPALDSGDSGRTFLMGKRIFLSLASLPILAGLLGLYRSFIRAR